MLYARPLSFVEIEALRVYLKSAEPGAERISHTTALSLIATIDHLQLANRGLIHSLDEAQRALPSS